MSPTDPRFRRAALLSSGAWAVHELRFTIAPVDGGVGPGHAYLHAALPALTVLIALAAIGFVARLVAPRREAVGSLRADWLSCALVLLVSFVLQETGESMLSAHGPVFAAGGWLGVPIAVVIGLGVALLLRGARAAVEAGARVPARLRLALPSPAPALFAPPAARRYAAAPLRHLSARPPPGLLVSQH